MQIVIKIIYLYFIKFVILFKFYILAYTYTDMLDGAVVDGATYTKDLKG